MTQEKIDEKIITTVIHFRAMEKMSAAGSMINEVKRQFTDMASGGDGGDLGFEQAGESTCRNINYKHMPDMFFQEVVDLMGWA